MAGVMISRLNSRQLDTRSLQPGIYMLQVSNGSSAGLTGRYMSQPPSHENAEGAAPAGATGSFGQFRRELRHGALFGADKCRGLHGARMSLRHGSPLEDAGYECSRE